MNTRSAPPIKTPFQRKCELLNYFLGDPIRPVMYTILGFQKIDWITPILEDNAENQYLSYFLAFNHNKCRIDYFLINQVAPTFNPQPPLNLDGVAITKD